MSWADSFLRDMVLQPLRRVWTHHGLPPDDIECVDFKGNAEPSIDSAFRIGTAAQTAMGLSALAATHFQRLRLPKEIIEDNDFCPQLISIDARHAVLEFYGECYYTVDGKLPATWKDDHLSDFYRTKDRGYVRLGCNFPHHKRGMLEFLGVPDDKEKVAEAILQFDKNDFVDKAQRAGLCAAALHDFESSDAIAPFSDTVNYSPVQLHRIDGVLDAPPRTGTVSPDSLPLDGIRMLDLTRLLSAPLAGRTMAMHGADVLYVTAPHLTGVQHYDRFTSLGKRTTQLDLNVPEERDKLVELLKDADVFIQSYRPGSLAARGFSAQDAARIRPGIVYASFGAFTYTSPYWFRKGFARDIEIQSGHVCEEAKIFKEWKEMLGEDTSDLPIWRDTPVRAVAHLAGLFLSFGITAALCKTITEGGSWEVHVSLESIALWLRFLGILSAEDAFDEEDNDMPQLPPRERPPQDGPPEHGFNLDDRVAAVSVETERDDGERGRPDPKAVPPFEKMTFVRHAATLSQTPLKIGKVPACLNAHEPKWLPRASDDITQPTEALAGLKL